MANEHSFVRYIHRKLPLSIYRWKIADRFQAGVPDAWYSGAKGSIFVEYKWLPRTPKKKFANPLTKLQRNWLADRAREGRTVAVAVGCPDGVILLGAPDQWAQDEISGFDIITREDYLKWLAMKVS